jgi:hypothetical protein
MTPAKHPGGRPSCMVREAWMLRFGLSYHHPDQWLPDNLLWQLIRCRNDEARRLILGKSE